MFFNTDLLTKRGPLARVWMASHLSTKLSKSHLLTTSIPSSVTSILGDSLVPMALRLSGQLLLGVARIYSRKTKYLLDDCNETLNKVKKAFKPGGGAQVDLEISHSGEGGEHAGDGITLRAEEGRVDDLLDQAGMDGNFWDMNYDLPAASTSASASAAQNKKGKANTSALADITLQEDFLDDFDAFNSGVGGNGAIEFDYGVEGGIDSFDIGGEMDLGLDEFMEEDVELGRGGAAEKKGKRPFSEVDEDEGMSVEMGRDQQVHLSERGSSIGLLDGEGLEGIKGIDREEDLGGFQDDGAFNDFDFGGGGEEEEQVVMNGDRETTPVPAPSTIALTPRTAKALASTSAGATTTNNAVKKQKTVTIDNTIELAWEDQKAVSARQGELYKEPTYMPRKRSHMRLLEREREGAGHYFLREKEGLSLRIPGLGRELRGLFKLGSRRGLIKAEKRLRDGGEGKAVDDVEIGRGGGGDFDFGGADDFNPNLGDDFGGGGNEEDLGGFDFDVHGDGGGEDSFRFNENEDLNVDAGASPRKKQKLAGNDSKAARKDEGPVIDYEDLVQSSSSSGPLAVFDEVISSSAGVPVENNTATQSMSLGEEEAQEENEGNGKGKYKWSRNTNLAIGVVKSELRKAEREEEEESFEFEKAADKATKRAAASFFFELLVLSTRDIVKVEQQQAFGSIKVKAQENGKLWEIAEMQRSQVVV